MQSYTIKSIFGQAGASSRKGIMFVLASLLFLAACESKDTVTDNASPEPGPDGVAPTLVTVSVQPNGNVSTDQTVRVDIVASESLLAPTVVIGGVPVQAQGGLLNWSASRIMTAMDMEGDVAFEIQFTDASGEAGTSVTATTDGSAANYCGDDCPIEGIGPLEGYWKLDFAGIGPSAGDTSWFSIDDTGPTGPRACWFDDLYAFGADGSFANMFVNDDTFLETWQGVMADSCGAPVAPHDGSGDAVFAYDEDAGELTVTGVGAFVGLAKAFNGGELTDPADAVEAITYNVVELLGNSLTINIDVGNGFWEFRLTRISNQPVVGNWRLNFAGVGPAAGDTSWFSIDDTGPTGPRACWFDDIYHIAGDGTFRNFMQNETFVEQWQGAMDDGCATPVAPHDGSAIGGWSYDVGANTITVNGAGSFLGLSKVINGAELTDPMDTPDSVTYNVVEVIGDSMTVNIEVAGGGFWEFRFDRAADAIDLKGNWKLDFAGIGPAAGDTSWFSIDDTGPTGPRACWFDDLYEFGADGSFSNNIVGNETFLETWQGVMADGCGAPVAPHDGTADAVFVYDSTAGTLELTGVGAFVGLAKAFNGGELTDPADAVESITYNVVEQIGNSLTINIDVGNGFWEFRLTKVSGEPVVGNWNLSFAGIGPAAGDTSWFSIDDTGPTGPRACWFDDVYHFADDQTFKVFNQNETFLEVWQGVMADGCGVPVAPHDGSTAGGWLFDGGANEVSVNGTGQYLGLAKAFNGGELTDPANAVDSITYSVVEIVDGSMKIRIDVGNGWWEFDLVKQ